MHKDTWYILLFTIILLVAANIIYFSYVKQMSVTPIVPGGEVTTLEGTPDVQSRVLGARDIQQANPVVYGALMKRLEVKAQPPLYMLERQK